jgi:very-short-patch-repair endonuclease
VSRTLQDSDEPPVIRRARVRPHKRQLARAFRRHPTASEQHAWQLLRNRRCLGLKFRRQQPLRGYVVDFYCAELRLVLEIDGAVHFEHEARFFHDIEREQHLREQGVELLRIRPVDVPCLPDILRWYLSRLPLSLQGEGAGG